LGQKVNPIIYRIGVNKDWDSKWFATGNQYIENLMEDLKVKKYLKNRLNGAMVGNVIISRKANSMNIDIHTARPGQVIGRKGAEIESLRNELTVLLNKTRKHRLNVFININEVKKPWTSATLVGEEVARQLRDRVSFRRAMKTAIRNAMRDGSFTYIKS